MGSRSAGLARGSQGSMAHASRASRASSLLHRPPVRQQDQARTAAPEHFAGIPAFSPHDDRAFRTPAPDLPRLPMQRKLVVGAVDDPMEREADAVAKRVAAGAAVPVASSASPTPTLRRQCSCGGSCDKCKDEEKDVLQRKPAGSVASVEAPSVVHDVLRGSGQPLDPSSRAFFEPRLGVDLRGVRVHVGAQAAQSAAAVDAKAFTVGRNIVFGANQYAPQSHAGRELLAHELAHTVQQSNKSAAPVIARACLPATECAKGAAGSLDTFVTATNADPVNASKAARRQTFCTATPRDPRCTSDGHGRPALELQKYLAAELPARAPAIKGLFVDMDMPANWGAYTNDCSTFTPPIPAGAGEQCTAVPNQFEQEAAVYNSGAATVGGRSRRSWSQEAVRRLTHETQHARFEETPGETKLSGNPCDFNSIKDSLTELTAIISEFRPVYLKIQALAEPARGAELQRMFRFWINGGGEDIAGNVKDIRCKCDCAPADAYIKNMFQFASKDWNTYQRWIYNKTLQAPEWHLNWPVNPPDSVPVDELPSTVPTVDIADLPKK